ncbi:uncharacterized protein NESG_01551 [Nematocida ausubeli]|uniref:Uncharacterized protein n=1 Tax=Nematocida ausubeli (strain ATCC PRA-371 / ERTm2) TaxID=1913371 RepID=A0A086J2R0_NEMA1|nr:uncharacterized protein NESG_01551 [Nematocida ausubeli]KFG26428.1 hypothetical protein NESG_01551 [Nematocida ausubeli]
MREVRDAQKVYIYTGLSVMCVFFVSALIWTGTQVYGSIYPTEANYLIGEKACVDTVKKIEDISESKEDSKSSYEMQSSTAKQGEKKTTEHELERNEEEPKSEEKTVCAPEENHTNGFAAESEEKIEMEAECVQEKPQINTDIIPMQWESNVYKGPFDKKANMKIKVDKMLKTFKCSSLTIFLDSICKLGTKIQEKKEIIDYCSSPSFESPNIQNINEFKQNMELLRQYIEKKMTLDKKGFSSFDALQRQVCQIEMAQQANKRHSASDIYMWLGRKRDMHAATAVLSMFICIPAVYADMREVSVEEIEQAYLPEKHTLSQTTLNGHCNVLKGVCCIVRMCEKKNARCQTTNNLNVKLNAKYEEIKGVLEKMGCMSPQDIYLAVHTSFSIFYEHALKSSTRLAGEGLFRSTPSHCIQLVHKKSNAADRTSIIFSTDYVADGHAAELSVRKASMHAAPGSKANMDRHAHVYYVDNTMQTRTRVCLPLCKGEVFAKAYKICDAIKCLSIIFSKDTESIYVLSQSKKKKGESKWAILNTEECNKVLATAIETHNVVFYHIENRTPGNREDSDYTAVQLASTRGKGAAGRNSKNCVSVPLFVTNLVRFAMNMLYSTCPTFRNGYNIKPMPLTPGTFTLNRINMPENKHPYYSPLYLGEHAVDLAAPYTDCQSLCAVYEDGGNTISWYAPIRTGHLNYICAHDSASIQREEYNYQNSTYLVKANASDLFRLVFSPPYVDSEKILVVQNISNNASCMGIEQRITAAIMGNPTL